MFAGKETQVSFKVVCDRSGRRRIVGRVSPRESVIQDGDIQPRKSKLQRRMFVTSSFWRAYLLYAQISFMQVSVLGQLAMKLAYSSRFVRANALAYLELHLSFSSSESNRDMKENVPKLIC